MYGIHNIQCKLCYPWFISYVINFFNLDFSLRNKYVLTKMIPVYHQHQQATKYEEKKQFFRKSFL